ncbi:hypothetical protein ACET3X_006220 [Alternaria dauci]|uniref:Uncharacterized protein n=1 Tax=Alternaria dauci TaxID=48095 RepID=A0ABR3UKD2_9PLEO
MNAVIVTEFTTVYPTDFVQATITRSFSSISAPETTSISSSAALRSGVLQSTISISSVVTPSPTSLPTSDTTIPLVGKPKFNDTFAYVTLGAIIALALLQIAMIAYLVYLRFKGECLNCHDLEKQLRKWNSGELKPITPQMIWRRNSLGKGALASKYPSDIDVEKGFVPHAMSRAPTLTQLENNKKPTLFQAAKAKVLRKAKSPNRTPDPPSDDNVDRFFTVDPDAPDVEPESSRRTSTLLPQTTYDDGNLYATRHSPYPESSIYSRNPEPGPNGANESRVFNDIWTQDIASMRRPLRKEADEPNPFVKHVPTYYNPYNARQKARNIAAAEATLESEEYKEAEAVLNRTSATDFETRRALSIVNLADQRLNVARHPSMYTEAGFFLGQSAEPEPELPERPESYQVLAWRKEGLRPAELEDIQEDFSPDLRRASTDKHKDT